MAMTPGIPPEHRYILKTKPLDGFPPTSGMFMPAMKKQNRSVGRFGRQPGTIEQFSSVPCFKRALNHFQRYDGRIHRGNFLLRLYGIHKAKAVTAFLKSSLICMEESLPGGNVP